MRSALRLTRHGCVKDLRQHLEQNPGLNMAKILRGAAAHGKLSICQHLLTVTNNYRTLDVRQAAAIAAMRGHLDVLKYFLDDHKVDLHDMEAEITEHITKFGHFQIRHELQLHGYACDMNPDLLLRYAIQHDYLLVVQEFLAEKHHNWSALACIASWHARDRILETILETYRINDDNKLFDIWFQICQHQNVKMMQIFMQHGYLNRILNFNVRLVMHYVMLSELDVILDAMLKTIRLPILLTDLYWYLPDVFYKRKWNVLRCLARHGLLHGDLISHQISRLAYNADIYGLYMCWCVGVEIELDFQKCTYEISPFMQKLISNLMAISRYPGLRGLAAAAYRCHYKHLPDSDTVPEDVMQCLHCFQHYTAPMIADNLEFKWRLPMQT